MMMKRYLLFVVLIAAALQVSAGWKWSDPARDTNLVVQGQGWPSELKGSYARLPERVREAVRPAVWNLSRNNAGIKVCFYSDAPAIRVRYQVAGGYSMPHMPSTGVSGIDLYARGENGEELWCAGKYSFADTIAYDFNNLVYRTRHKKGYEYSLYLPLYNTVKWLEIGVPDSCCFEFMPLPAEKPVVVYGTSIAQGACASRPGMAWTALLERDLDCPLVNLGFSGNGKLEKEMVGFVGEIDARLYVVDCMPNMYAADDPEKLLVAAVKQIREKHPRTPVLITEHGGYTNELTNDVQRGAYVRANEAARRAFQALEEEGVPELHYLSRNEIGMDMNAMVDGVHPTDWGMTIYARAYGKKIREILNQPIGECSTARPVRQRREADGYDWNGRHEQILELNRKDPPRSVIIGNSIVHYWGGEPESQHKHGAETWKEWMTPGGFRNLGFGWDRIENVLWRVYHGELDGFQAQRVVLMIGTNNLEDSTDQEILTGLKMLADAIRHRQPSAELRLVGILPRRGYEKRIAMLNRIVGKIAKETGASYVEAGTGLLTSRGTIDESLFRDGLHPNGKGYARIAPEIVR